MGMTPPKKWQADTSWDDIEPATMPPEHAELIVKRFTVGPDPADMDSPVVIRTEFPPGFRVEPHTHVCDYAEIILEGSQQVTRKWYHAGDIRIAKAGTVYGPLIAGPEGCTVLFIFSRGDRELVEPKDVAARFGA